MLGTRVMSLPNWPPDPGGATPGRYISPSSEQAIIARAEPRIKDRLVTFVGTFEGLEHTYDYEAPSEEIASSLRRLIGGSVGKSVYQVGLLEVAPS
jgi:hypothetical protein